MPLFSVIVPTYNRSDLIRPTLDSVLAQGGDDFEIVVADDGSTDDTPEVLASYGNRIRVFRQENKGEGAARNLAIQQARGIYLVFLDSDDVWFPWTLEILRGAIEEHRPSFIVGSQQPFTADSELASVRRTPAAMRRYENLYAAFEAGLGFFIPSATVMNREALTRVGLFAERRSLAVDFDLFMRMGTAPGFVQVEAPLTYGCRMHTGNLSHSARLNYLGATFLLAQERAGKYPGGERYRPERERRIAALTRNATYACGKQGLWREGLELYSRAFAWQVRYRRWRYLVGFWPLWMLGTLQHGWRKKS